MSTARRSELERGTVVGRFEVEGIIGEGGMGVVYAARDHELRRRVALKLLRTTATEDSGGSAQRRLLREARAMAAVSHPNLVTVYDVGVYVADVFIAMEHVRGTPLGDWLIDQSPSTEAIVDVYEQAGRALAAAHHAGLVHRDFKPDNVLVTPSGQAKLLDLGIARRYQLPDAVKSSAVEMLEGQGDALDEDSVSSFGDVQPGTPAYMSPEQLLGTPASPASDQFSFGIALFEALTGYYPFEGATELERISNRIAGRVREWPEGDVPEQMHQVVEQMLAGRPEARYPAMEAALDAVRSALGVRGQIRFLAARWQRHGRRDEFLMGADPMLDEGVALLDANPGAFDPEQRAFLEASATARRGRLLKRRALLGGIGALAAGFVPLVFWLRRSQRELRVAARDVSEGTLEVVRLGVEGLFGEGDAQLSLMLGQKGAWISTVERALSSSDPTVLLDAVSSANDFFGPVVHQSALISSLMVATDDFELLVFDDPDGSRFDPPYDLYNRVVNRALFGDSAYVVFSGDEGIGRSQWLRAGEFDARGNPWTGYSPAERVWFQRARAAEGHAWTRPYLFFTSKDVGITGATGFMHRGRRFVLGIDLMLTDISLITMNVEDPNVLAVVLTRGDEVVGLPRSRGRTGTDDVRQFYRRFDAVRRGDEDAILPRVGDLGEPVIEAAVAALASANGDAVVFTHEGHEHFVRRSAIGQPDQDLSVVVVVRSD
ncbi:MAG: hypothetical protein CMN30_04310 [Sandaracinus sp.]|nr:hypothetical protein [Sandaracinus sp.]|tara:strand:+ start:15 stop:2165 length:2151 start_codon:yes stop_codon:yes gene_type:complete